MAIGELDGHPLGMIASSPDERDRPLAAYHRILKAEELPEEFILPELSVMRDQGSVSSCVGCGLDDNRNQKESKELGRPFRGSVQFIYSNRAETDHQGEGMQPRQALLRLRDFGVPPESFWPGLAEYGKETWPADREALFAAAKPHRIQAFVRVEPSFILQLKTAIYTLGPALFCVPVHTNFRPDSEGRIPLPKGNLRGGHAMSARGWRPGAYCVKNSWGAAWGLGGYCWIPWGFPASEVWSITDAVTRRQRIVTMRVGSKTLRVNGKTIEMDIAPFLKAVPGGDRTFVPLRWAAEALGASVSWDQATQTVTIEFEELPWS